MASHGCLHISSELFERHKVPPPLMNIITASSMEVYNQVARILFRVKYARYRLDLEGWGENRGGKRNGHLGTNIARRKAAVKARLMHFVTGLYGFFNAVSVKRRNIALIFSKLKIVTSK